MTCVGWVSGETAVEEPKDGCLLLRCHPLVESSPIRAGFRQSPSPSRDLQPSSSSQTLASAVLAKRFTVKVEAVGLLSRERGIEFNLPDITPVIYRHPSAALIISTDRLSYCVKHCTVPPAVIFEQNSVYPAETGYSHLFHSLENASLTLRVTTRDLAPVRLPCSDRRPSQLPLLDVNTHRLDAFLPLSVET